MKQWYALYVFLYSIHVKCNQYEACNMSVKSVYSIGVIFPCLFFANEHVWY